MKGLLLCISFFVYCFIMKITKILEGFHMTISAPKVVVIGAGSLFFGRQAIWQMVHSEHLNKGTLALVDTDEERLNKLVKLANMIVKENKVDLKIEGSTDRQEVLMDADFVVLSFA